MSRPNVPGPCGDAINAADVDITTISYTGYYDDSADSGTGATCYTIANATATLTRNPNATLPSHLAANEFNIIKYGCCSPCYYTIIFSNVWEGVVCGTGAYYPFAGHSPSDCTSAHGYTNPYNVTNVAIAFGISPDGMGGFYFSGYLVLSAMDGSYSVDISSSCNDFAGTYTYDGSGDGETMTLDITFG